MPYKSPYDFPDEHMRVVGIIAAHWEAIDIILQRAVAEVMSLDFERVRLLTENLSVNAMFDLILVHSSQLPPEKRKPFNSMINQVQAAYGKRNEFVHAKWTTGPARERPIRISIRTKGGKLKAVEEPTPIEELEAAAAEIFEAGNLIVSEFRKFGLLKASP